MDSYSDIPVDLIIEILLRLPAQSLLRFKSVCRLWNNIISSTSFVYKHSMFHQSSTIDFSGFLQCFLKPYGPYTSTYYDAYRFLRPNVVLPLEPYHNEIASRRIYTYVGPCHGVFLVRHLNYPEELALWNPTTVRIKLLPPPPANIKVKDWYRLAIGVDPLAPGLQFKIVLMRHDWHEPYLPVYNSSTQLWKLVEDPIFIDYPAFDVYSWGVYANGFIYWLLCNGHDDEYLILAMDLRNDSFLTIKPPCTVLSGYMPKHLLGLDPELGLYNDSLALITNVEGDILPDTTIMVDVWCMEGQGRWTKLTTTSLMLEIDPVVYVIGFWSRSKIYIKKDKKTLVIYDIDSGNTTEFDFQKAGEFLKDSFSYQASLVSI